MSLRFIIRVVGRLLALFAGALCVPAGMALYESFPLTWAELAARADLLGFLLAAASSLLTGFVLILLGGRDQGENSAREGFAIVTFGWITITFFGALPLFMYFVLRLEQAGLSHLFLCFTDSFFESMSSFTATGSSVLRNIESLPAPLIFWRCLMQWLGGMGFATLALAIFPAFGISAYQVFRGETPGPQKERLTPKLAQTAKVLWSVYLLLTVLQAFLLLFGGMSLFDSICHSLTTISTGGISTRDLSVAAFNSAYVEWVIIIFMFLSGMNFMIHYRILFNRTLLPLKRNREFHFYAGIIILASTAVFLLLFRSGTASLAVSDALRSSVFQVVSVTTTTGFSTANFDAWPALARFTLLILMLCGGCAGSTSGGIKMVRVLVLLKAAWREVKTMIQPRLIAPVKIAGEPVEDKMVSNIVGFVALFLLLLVGASALMCLLVPDMVTAVSSVIACTCNLGPGLAGVGPTESFAWIPPTGKWVLILCMLLGRLEIYTVLIAFAPRSYRK